MQADAAASQRGSPSRNTTSIRQEPIKYPIVDSVRPCRSASYLTASSMQRAVITLSRRAMLCAACTKMAKEVNTCAGRRLSWLTQKVGSHYLEAHAIIDTVHVL